MVPLCLPVLPVTVGMCFVVSFPVVGLPVVGAFVGAAVVGLVVVGLAVVDAGAAGFDVTAALL